MLANEQVAKKTYVKPELVTHGSVQQLTEGGVKSAERDCGSGIKLPFHPGQGPANWGW